MIDKITELLIKFWVTKPTPNMRLGTLNTEIKGYDNFAYGFQISLAEQGIF